MPGRRVLPRILFPIWPDMQRLADEWKAFIERTDAISFVNADLAHDANGGKVVIIPTAPGTIKVAKVGGAGIPPMTGTAPGSGAVTLHTFDPPDLKPMEGGTATAYNMHPTESVAGGAWVKVCYINSRWFVFWEPCA